MTFRRRSTRASADFTFRKDRSKFVITPLEFSVCKTTEPAPHVEMKGLGMEISVPMDDETLVVALALLFGKFFPVYM